MCVSRNCCVFSFGNNMYGQVGVGHHSKQVGDRMEAVYESVYLPQPVILKGDQPGYESCQWRISVLCLFLFLYRLMCGEEFVASSKSELENQQLRVLQSYIHHAEALPCRPDRVGNCCVTLPMSFSLRSAPDSVAINSRRVSSLRPCHTWRVQDLANLLWCQSQLGARRDAQR